MKISVVGTGYVGLVTGTCFAETGNEVICVDIDETKVSNLKKGIIPIYEPGLEVIFHRNIKEQRLSFTTNLGEAIKGSEVIFLALPTPPGEDGSADLSYILNVADELGPLLEAYTVVVDKSTVPVGTAEKVRANIAKRAKVDFDVVSNPEFLREGFAVADFMKPDRIVIGTTSTKAQALIKQLYKPYTRQGNPIYFMDESSAEMTKYAANAFLATKISFMNEISNLCELVGADVDSVRLGIGADERIGKRFLFPGIGYGGSCFPKDVKALIHIASENDYEFEISKAVESVNHKQKHLIFQKVSRYFKGNLKGKRIALWGLAFKPDTDDIREAPAIEIINDLLSAGAIVTAYDPEASDNVKRIYIKSDPRLSFADDAYSALDKVDALIIATEWSEFRNPDFKKMKSQMSAPVVFDGRNIFDLATMGSQEFYYESMGRSVVNG
jgi:UDPglucose 6-dehydrogenase